MRNSLMTVGVIVTALSVAPACATKKFVRTSVGEVNEKVTALLLREISQTRSLVVVEHDMEFVRALECKVTVLHEGSVLAEGSLETVQQDERVIEVYLGR